MIERIRELINIKKFLKEESIEYIESDYGRQVTGLCNNAVAFIFLMLLSNDENIEDFEIHNGIYEDENIKHQHSWIVCKSENKILDITLKQFNEKYEEFYIGETLKELTTLEKVNCKDPAVVICFLSKI